MNKNFPTWIHADLLLKCLVDNCFELRVLSNDYGTINIHFFNEAAVAYFVPKKEMGTFIYIYNKFIDSFVIESLHIKNIYDKYINYNNNSNLLSRIKADLLLLIDHYEYVNRRKIKDIFLRDFLGVNT